MIPTLVIVYVISVVVVWFIARNLLKTDTKPPNLSDIFAVLCPIVNTVIMLISLVRMLRGKAPDISKKFFLIK